MTEYFTDSIFVIGIIIACILAVIAVYVRKRRVLKK
ncbi:EYxxD motif small membrane protein [Massilibacterium senegalense]